MPVSDDQLITLTFTVSQINKMLLALGDLPFAKVADMILAIRTQGEEQLAAIAASSTEEPVSEPSSDS